MKTLLLALLASAASMTSYADTPPTDADFVDARLKNDGFAVKSLELEVNLKPSHQFSHFFAPAADLAQRLINPDLVTLKYYDVHFETAEGYRYRCVAAVGNNEQLKKESRYVEIEDCGIALDDEGTFLKSKIVQLSR